MKAICNDDGHTFRNRLTIGNVYDVLKLYIDKYKVSHVDIVCDDGEIRPYQTSRFTIVEE